MNIIIVGGGDYVHYITRSLLSKGERVTVINNNLEECERLSLLGKAVVVHGDGTLPGVLEDAGVRKADRVLAVTSHDEDNFVVCQLSQRWYNVRSTFALVYDPENAEVFRELGIEGTFSVSETLALLIEGRAASEAVRNLQPLADGRINLTEVLLPETSPALGKPLRTLKFPESTLLVSVLREDEVTIPNGETVLREGESVSFLSFPDRYAAALAALVGKDRT